jgi:molybdopterin molybdotransferase
MISFSEAINRIVKSVRVSQTEKINLDGGLGRVLAQDIFSPLDLPPFHQSAMDGYAVHAADAFPGKKLTVTGESTAGKSYSKKTENGHATRIFTGAEIPQGADAVVMQEKTSLANGSIGIEDENVSAGLNIRTKGSQIKEGALAMSKGTVLTPAALGFLASMGLKIISVFSLPSVSILVTGNELQKPGTKLARGKIFESNSPTLEAALKQSGIEKIKIIFVRDDLKQTRTAFRTAMRVSDFILFTGGISVGDYDFVGHVLKDEKVNEIFYKVKQKPGKPLYFGTKNKKYIFGLPGNPASVLTCFYEYVLPAARKFMGHASCRLPVMRMPLSKDVQKKKGMTHFLKAVTDFTTVTPLEGQESYIMRSYAKANCLVVIPEEAENVATGELVETHLLP